MNNSGFLDGVIEQLDTTAFADIELGPFANRSELASELLEHIYLAEKEAEEEIATGDSDLDTYFDGIIATFDWNVDNPHLRRVVFEMAVVDPAVVNRLYHRWREEAVTDLQALGLTNADAVLEARILTNLFDGFLYDLTINNDVESTRPAFLIAMGRYRDRLVHLIELSV